MEHGFVKQASGHVKACNIRPGELAGCSESTSGNHGGQSVQAPAGTRDDFSAIAFHPRLSHVVATQTGFASGE